MSLSNLPGSGNSLVGNRDDDNSVYLPSGYCQCIRCGIVTTDATNDGDEICAECLIVLNEQKQELLELQQQDIMEEIWA